MISFKDIIDFRDADTFKIISSFIDSFPFYVLLIDSDHHILMANNTIKKIVNMSDEQLIGKFCPRVIHGMDSSFPGCPLEESVKKNQAIEKELFDSHSKRWVLSCIYPLEWKTTDQKKVYLHITQDITERKNAEILRKKFNIQLEENVKSKTHELNNAMKEQEKLLKRLESNVEFKSNFLRTVSHELRTPLNAIIGFTDLILEDSKTSKNETYYSHLTDIEDSSAHMLNLLNTFLDLTKIEAGEIEIHKKHFNLNEFLNQIYASIRPLLENKNLGFKIIGDRLIEVFADPTLLKQILLNLLGNAIKFTNKGSITVEISDKASSVEFRIIDTGIGINKKDNDLVFKEFKRVDSDLVRDTLGTGLGLPIAKKLVEVHGGTIDFTSSIGEGTTFIFTISKTSDS